MTRTTVDFGIDLGTTNSCIAMLEGIDVEVIRNNDGFDYTPSIIWIDKKNRLFVGRTAKDRLEDDPENAYAEFKLQMGTDHEYRFSHSGRVMKPEELSAEVLKELKTDVKQRKGEDLQAVVISVPAAFELPQCAATRKAAELAGLTFSPLVQEPVAAAVAYGFQDDSDKVFWLVYDLGGGTFDAAIMQVRDGVIQVVNHGGDNHLGGKLIDWKIVDELLVPALTKEHPLTDFRRSNARWRVAFAKLKMFAEDAKIRISRYESTDIMIDMLCEDDEGKTIEFEYELKRGDVERLIEPLVVRSINICKKVMGEKRLGASDIEKVILVGGPTITPYLRERLVDSEEGLGIPLEFSIDPLTIVAQGAAIFAGTQRIEGITVEPAKEGQYTVELEYKPVGPDIEPLVGGRVMAPAGEELDGFTIEFINAEARPQWRSGKIALDANGVFMNKLLAEKGRKNVFLVELCNSTGTILETVPDRLTYTVGQVITEQPLIHSMGVALANNEVKQFFEKGAPLPAHKMHILKTAFEVRKGQEGDLLRIPVIEGGNQRADRNRLIGALEVHADHVRRDIPAGSEVEVTIVIDESRLVRTKAYVPILDEEYEEVHKLEKAKPDPKELGERLQREKKRLEEARSKARGVGDRGAEEIIQNLDRENVVQDVETSLDASDGDRDALDKAQNRLRELQIAIDELEDAIEWPALLAEAEAQITNAQDIVQKYGERRDKQLAETLERETRQATETRDVDLLRRKVDELMDLRMRVLAQQPDFWVGFFEHLEKRKADMHDRAMADSLISQGRRAINNNDLPSLQAAVKQLFALLPPEEREKSRDGYDSTVL